MSIEVPSYGDDELEEIAQAFHREHCGEPIRPPVDIEWILECAGVEIIPSWNLERDFGVNGLLSLTDPGGRYVVYVDEWMCDHQEQRYRFTLAEEYGHIRLQGPVFGSVHNLENAIRLRNELSRYDVWLMDREARQLAGAILIPASHLIQMTPEILPSHLNGRSFASETHLMQEASEILAEIYNVSSECMRIRLTDKAAQMKQWVLDRYGDQIV